MNFEEDIKIYIVNEFKFFGVQYSLTGDLDMDLLNLFTVQRKYVYPFKRAVKLSRELIDKLSTSQSKYQSEVKHLQLLFCNQGNVNPFLSNKLFAYRVHDPLVYAWNIFHFHLSTKRTKYPNFNDRTDELLFVYITKDLALLIDIQNHKPYHETFANKRLLEIIDNNWPDILLASKDTVALSQDLSNADRFKLRKYQINELIVEINGKFIFGPGQGITASGHSSQDVGKLNAFRDWVDRNQNAIETNKEIANEYFKARFSLSKDILFKLVFTNDGPQICDENSAICLLKYTEVFNV